MEPSSTTDVIPKYHELMYPTLRAVDRLGGSGKSRQIEETVLEDLAPPDELVAITYPGREKSVYLDRMAWARSYCKLGGAVERPKRGLLLLTALGREILAQPEDIARQRLREMDRQVRAARPRKSASKSEELVDEDQPVQDPEDDEATDESGWRDALLARLHQLSPTAFERFVIALLTIYDLDLEHRGGSGDEGIDAIGTAPLSPVLSATVAVQAKRHDPTTEISRETVALFQRDAAAAGAERAIMVTLGRYSLPAQKASQTTTPTVDLIGGARICDLMLEQAQAGRDFGLRIVPQVIPGWFDKFEV